jgi:hypothetical protein
MPDELQLLPPDKTRDPDNHILLTHLESLLLLTSTKFGREHMRESGVYPIIRETHLHMADEDEHVAAACDRIVQVSIDTISTVTGIGNDLTHLCRS